MQKTAMLVFIVLFEMNKTPTLNARDVRSCVAKSGPRRPGFTLLNEDAHD